MKEPLHGRASALALPSGRAANVFWLGRNRYQLLVAVIVGVALPALIVTRFDLSMMSPGGSGLANTIAGTFAAVLLGAYLRRRMTTYPGAGSIAVVLPAFGAAYGAAVAIFFLLRLDYSRLDFIASFLFTVAWFGFVGVIEPGIRRPRLLLLPFGKADKLLSFSQADWVVAQAPTQIPHGVTGAVADLRADMPPEWERLLSKAALSGLPVYHWKQVAESLSGTVDIEHISENNLGSLLPSSVYLRFKYIIDVGLAVVTLPLTLPVLALTAVAILICDGRPILFRQTRTGLGGHPFTVFKFRTMVQGAEAGRPFTTQDDPRITRLGHWLRRYRLDELLQIVNIVRGEMSWIGPRPESLPLAQWYESQVAFYSYRHIVRPGITGWAAVHQGNVAEIDAATAKLKYDFYYCKYVSPWLDLMIAAKTVKILLNGFGAR